MGFDSQVHHRRSIRLQGYDYAQAGCYFVTLCAQSKACLFGGFTCGQLALSPAGLCLYQWWNRLSAKFPGIEIDAFIVMPNHIHGLLHLGPHESQVVRTDPATLGSVIAWYKTMTTNAYIRGVKEAGWPRFDGTLWQRNYYEHIVRNESDLTSIREYIENNPVQWALDNENPDNL